MLFPEAVWNLLPDVWDAVLWELWEGSGLKHIFKFPVERHVHTSTHLEDVASLPNTDPNTDYHQLQFESGSFSLQTNRNEFISSFNPELFRLQKKEDQQNSLWLLEKGFMEEELTVEFRKRMLQTLHSLHLVTPEPGPTQLLKHTTTDPVIHVPCLDRSRYLLLELHIQR